MLKWESRTIFASLSGAVVGILEHRIGIEKKCVRAMQRLAISKAVLRNRICRVVDMRVVEEKSVGHGSNEAGWVLVGSSPVASARASSHRSCCSGSA